MPLIILLIAVLLIVAAIRNSQSALFSAIATDVPEFVVWAAAIVALGVAGFVPGLKPISRGLLVLVLVVLVLNNYQAVIAGFQNAWQKPPAPAGGASGAAPAKKSSSPFGIDLGSLMGSMPFSEPGFGGSGSMFGG